MSGQGGAAAGAGPARLAIRVQPGARRTGLAGRLSDGTIKIAVTAPPEDGRANAALIEWLAEALGLRPRQVRVVRGAASRSKTIEIEGLDENEVLRRLGAHAARPGKGRANDGQ